MPNNVKNGGRVSDDLQQQHMTMSEKKKARNIKNKRLLMHNDDATELRITWEEAQELFRPSPSSEPTVVMVEDHEFEEFDVNFHATIILFVEMYFLFIFKTWFNARATA